jgi:hypothetical protein
MIAAMIFAWRVRIITMMMFIATNAMYYVTDVERK